MVDFLAGWLWGVVSVWLVASLTAPRRRRGSNPPPPVRKPAPEVWDGPSLADVDELCAEFGFHYDDTQGESLEILQEMVAAAITRWRAPAAQPVDVANLMRLTEGVDPFAPGDPEPDHIERLAEIIREVDGRHELGVTILAEQILAHPGFSGCHDGPAPALPAPEPRLLWSWETRSDGIPPAPAIPADRLALAMCSWRPVTCANPCALCRAQSAAVAHELAAILRERHGSSATADWLDGVGCHPRTVQTVQEGKSGIEWNDVPTVNLDELDAPNG